MYDLLPRIRIETLPMSIDGPLGMGNSGEKKSLSVDDVWPSATRLIDQPLALAAESFKGNKRVLVAAARSDQVGLRVVFVLSALVVMCVLLAGIVWWRLLA